MNVPSSIVSATGALLGLLISAVPASPARADAAVDLLETCFVEPPEEVSDQIGPFDCGYVIVPENHERDNGREVQLGFVRLPARGEAVDVPLFMLSGGPGSTLLNPVTFSLFSDEFLGPLREDRDIVILEERGSFHSVPSLDCPLSHRVPWMANRLGLDRDGERALYREVFADCVAQARAHGIDLAQYNSLAIAADIDASRRALGYERIVYYGASYGAQLGQATWHDYCLLSVSCTGA